MKGLDKQTTKDAIVKILVNTELYREKSEEYKDKHNLGEYLFDDNALKPAWEITRYVETLLAQAVQEALAKQGEEITKIIDNRVPGDTADYERGDFVDVVNEIRYLIKDSTKEIK